MRARPKNDIETAFFGHPKEARDVEARIGLAEIEHARLALVHGPRHVRVEDLESHGAHRVEARSPICGRVTPVMHRAADERKDLFSAEIEAVRMEANALFYARAVRLRMRRHA